jgi:hypothetical protein
MADVLTYEDCVVNFNAATVGGRIVKVEQLSGKTVGLVFHVAVQKHWPSGVQEIPIRCYISGAERIAKLGWLKPGAWALVRGEITDRGSVYALDIQQLPKAGREPGEDDDEYLASAQRQGRR